MPLPPPDAYLETLTPDKMVFGDRAFGVLGHEGRFLMTALVSL